MNMRNCFVFDIDGTCANGDHRRHFIQGPKGTKNWPAYQKLAHMDTPIDPVRRMFTMVRSSEHTDAVFVTGRSETEREVTERWLSDHGFINHAGLFMRPARDNRVDWMIKEEILDNVLLKQWNVLGVFDDRPQVIRMWKRRGIFVFNIDQREDMEEF